jgi:ATP-dependent protease ClpP protease subunit
MSTKYKYVRNITESEATIEVFGEVGGFEGINGRVFADEMNFLASLGIDKINVPINSPGGAVLDGITIFTSIQNAVKKGKRVDTIVEGLAGSIAGIIAMGGETRHINDFGRIMIHSPFIADKDGVEVLGISEEDKKAIDNFGGMIVEIFSKQTGKSEEEIKSLMTETTWLNASESLQQGFTDNIINTGRFSKVENAISSVDLNPKLVYNRMSKILNNVTSKTILKQKKMKLVLSNLGLSEDASEASALDKLNALNNKISSVEALEADKTSLEEKVEALETENSELKKSNAEAIFNNAVSQGKIEAIDDEKAKGEFIDSIVANPEAFKNTLKGVKTPSKKIVDNLNVGGEAKDDKSAWDFTTYSQRDPKGLEKMRVDNLEGFKNLFKREFGIDYNL